MALPGNKIDVDWQSVPDKDQNCEIAQYLVQYRTKQTEWKDLYTSNNHTFSVQVENLVPWTWYEVQVASFTRQVSPGLGPFSAIVEIKTLQGVPGPVQNVSFRAGITEIYLVWKTPAKLNGVLTGYRLDYHRLSLTDLNEWTAVMVITSYTELSDLLPDTGYNISIRAISGGGAGNATFLKVWTAAQPTPTLSLQQEPQTLEEVMETLTTTAATSAGSKNLPAIVGGTLVGVAILVTICVIFLCRWCRSKTENSAKYLIQDGSTQFSGYGSGSFYRHIEDSSNTSFSTQHASSSSSDQQQQQHDHNIHRHHKGEQQQISSSPHYQAANNNTLRQLPDTSWLAQQAQQTEGGSKGPSVYLPGGETDIKPVCSPGQTSYKGVFTIDGVDNLGFVSDSLSLPGLPSDNCGSPLAAEGGLIATQTKKRGRMSSESAAAIAMMRSSQVTSLIMDDTETLLTHDFCNIPAEVVFKHRTVL
ncbi:uncharacterized protein LOC112574734 [Pomacea canaliculata]|nr:uncharacterized protein LOC112574734 [Pomacea canaliculata]